MCWGLYSESSFSSCTVTAIDTGLTFWSIKIVFLQNSPLQNIPLQYFWKDFLNTETALLFIYICLAGYCSVLLSEFFAFRKITITVLYSFKFSQQHCDSWGSGLVSETVLQLIFISFLVVEGLKIIFMGSWNQAVRLLFFFLSGFYFPILQFVVKEKKWTISTSQVKKLFAPRVAYTWEKQKSLQDLGLPDCNVS